VPNGEGASGEYEPATDGLTKRGDTGDGATGLDASLAV
jgi:hypothetical protein